MVEITIYGQESCMEPYTVVWFADDKNSVQVHELLPYIGKMMQFLCKSDVADDHW